MKNNRVLSWILFAALILSGGCQTLPSGWTHQDIVSILPSDSYIYLCIDSNRSKDLVNKILENSPYASGDTSAVLSRTSRIYAGLVRKPAGGTGVSMVLVGEYPLLMINTALSWNAEWEEEKGDFTFWKNNSQNMELALPSGRLVFLAESGIRQMLEALDSGKQSMISGLVENAIETSDFLVFFPFGIDEATASELSLNFKRTLIREIWIRGDKTGNVYAIDCAVHLSDEIRPEAFKRLFQFVMLAIIRQSDLENGMQRLKDVVFTVEEQSVRMSGFSMSEKEVVMFASSFFGGD